MKNSNQKEIGWSRKQLKREGRKALKRNYFQALLVSLVIFFFVKGFHDISKKPAIDNLRLSLHGQSNITIVNDLIQNSNRSLGDLVKPYLVGKQGVLYGPWLPIYGSGGVLILIFLKRFRPRPLLYFGSVMVVCGSLEYLISCWLEYSKGAMWWNYHKMFLNLNGRICLEGLLFFGLGGMIFTYIFAPFVNQHFQKIPKKTGKIICTILIICFLSDLIYSEFHPNMAAGKEIQMQKK